MTNDKAQYRVGVVGAMGMVGSEMIATLEQRGFPVSELRPLDVPQNVGAEVSFNGQSIACQEANADNFAGLDLAIFSAGGAASAALAPSAAAAGAVVIDNSSQWRMHDDCPLVVPEVNPEALADHKGIVANPNCSTIQMLVALSPIHRAATIRRIVVSTYQAASGGGHVSNNELRRQAEQVLAGEEPTVGAFTHQLAFNLIPHIDEFVDGGYTKEEMKLVHETHKILSDDSIGVSPTAVRVPVHFGHSESINVETETKLSAAEVRALLVEAHGVTVQDDPANNLYPMPARLAGSDGVFVGRIREDPSINNGINLWCVADNTRKGAALNAVQIAETLVSMDLVDRDNWAGTISGQ